MQEWNEEPFVDFTTLERLHSDGCTGELTLHHCVNVHSSSSWLWARCRCTYAPMYLHTDTIAFNIVWSTFTFYAVTYVRMCVHAYVPTNKAHTLYVLYIRIYQCCEPPTLYGVCAPSMQSLAYMCMYLQTRHIHTYVCTVHISFVDLHSKCVKNTCITLSLIQWIRPVSAPLLHSAIEGPASPPHQLLWDDIL